MKQVSRACGERAGERAQLPERSEARVAMAGLPAASMGGPEPTGLGQSGRALRLDGARQHSREEGIDAQSKLYKSTVLQHLGF